MTAIGTKTAEVSAFIPSTGLRSFPAVVGVADNKTILVVGGMTKSLEYSCDIHLCCKKRRGQESASY